MKNFLFAFALAVLCSTCLRAQELPLFPQHAEHATLINPAAMSVEHQLSEDHIDWGAWLGHRNQWARSDGPKYLAGRFEWSRTGEVNGFRLAALGAHVLSFQTGPVQRNGAFLRAAFRQKLNHQWRLCIGASLGAVLYQADLAQLALLHPNDPALADLPRTQAHATLGTGAFVYYSNSKGGTGGEKTCAWAGLSMPQMLALPFRQRDTTFARTGWRGGPLYATAGWHKTVGEEGAKGFVEPSIWLKTERGLPPVPEASLKAGLKWDGGRVRKVWLCGGYALQTNMLHAEFGLDWNIRGAYTARTMATYDLFRQSYRSAFPAAFELDVAFFRQK